MYKKFLLRKDIYFFNHGSFGATPKKVFEAYQNYQKQLEKQPVEFIARKSGKLLENVRKNLAEFLNTDKNSIAFVKNSTTAINIIAKSLNLKPGDQVLTTDHEYGALNRMWQILSEQYNFSYIKSRVKLPYSDTKTFINNFTADITAKTKVIFLSHITSPTALIFPVKEICEIARQKNIITIIDGAHAPGQINLNLNEINPDFYAGNCHKWMMAPKGSAFIYAESNKQNIIKPLITSWGKLGSNSKETDFIAEMQSQATFDFSAYLAVNDAIKFLKKINREKTFNRNKKILLYAKNKLTETLKTQNIVSDNNLFPLMYAQELPENIDAEKLKSDLWDKYKIEIPVTYTENKKFIRISIQIYNTKKQVDYLIKCLKQLLNQ